MSRQLFEVGERVLLVDGHKQSGEYVVSKSQHWNGHCWNNGKVPYTGWTYWLNGNDPEMWWCESELRKLPPLSPESFEEIMADANKVPAEVET